MHDVIKTDERKEKKRTKKKKKKIKEKMKEKKILVRKLYANPCNNLYLTILIERTIFFPTLLASS